MKRPQPRAVARFGGLALAAFVLAFPAGAAATTNEPIAQTGGMTATLPLLGASLQVGVTLDEIGDISGVTLDPTGVVSQTSADDHAVKFANSDGTTKVSVRAKGDRLSIAAKSAKLADLVGDGTWAAKVFGGPTASTVAYSVGDDGSGNPTLAIGAITTPGGVTSTLGTPHSKTGDHGAWASGGVVFTQGGYTKRLTITVAVRKDGTASLKLALTGRDKQRLAGTLAELLGPRTWSAHLCDKTAVAVNFHVADDGTVVFDSATGGPATSKTFDGLGHGFGKGKHGDKGAAITDVSGLFVRFTDTKVGMSAVLWKLADGTYKLSIKGFSGRCGSDHSGHHGGFPGWGGHDGDSKGGHS